MKARPEYLTAEEEKQIVLQAKAGDTVARDRLIESQIRMVYKQAKRFASFSMPVSDLVQEGVLGLMRALRSYNADQGLRYWTYAKHWVIVLMVRAKHNKSAAIRIPTYLQVQPDGMWKGKPIPHLPQAFTLADSSEGPRFNTAATFVAAAERHDHVAESDDREESQHHLNQLRLAWPTLDDDERKLLKLEFGLGGSKRMSRRNQRAALRRSGESITMIREDALSKLRKALRA